MADDKVMQIFRELVGERARKLDGSHFPADIKSRITQALAADHDSPTDERIQPYDGMGFHLVDWQSNAAFIVALVLFPERFTDEEIRDGVEGLLWHVPAHVLEAARLGGYPTENIFAKPDTDDDNVA